MEDLLSTNISKLRFWSDRILNIEEKPQPINLVIGLTGKCNLKCPFCCCFDNKPINIDFDKLINFIEKLTPPLKSVELLGGEPLLYPYINEVIEFCHKKGLKIGIMTNGTLLNNIKKENYEKIEWLRVSINHYIDNDKKYNPVYIPDNVYYGFNYIYYKQIENSFSFEKLINFKDKYKGLYIRISLDRECDSETKTKYCDLLEKSRGLKNHGVFMKPLVSDEPYKGKCYIGYLKPLLEWDGKVYNCCTELEVIGHSSKQCITDIDHPEKLLQYPKDRIMSCRRCFYINHNNYIKNMLSSIHKEFL